MQREGHTASALSDGRVLVVGGVGGVGVVGDEALLAPAEVWDRTTGSFGPAGTLAEARLWHTAITLLDGRVIIVGGRDADGDWIASAEIWEATR